MSRVLALLALITVTTACTTPGPVDAGAATRTTLEHQAQEDLAS